MGFKTWETKFGVVVLHGNVKKSEMAFDYFPFFNRSYGVPGNLRFLGIFQQLRP